MADTNIEIFKTFELIFKQMSSYVVGGVASVCMCMLKLVF